MIALAWGAVTDTGRMREINQDGVLSAEPVFAVADGMGGHRGGEVASAIAVKEMAKITTVSGAGELIDAVQQANREIIDRARLDPALYGMGTTMVTLVAMTVDDEERLCVANVGDSRLYVRTVDEMLQLTDDHSLVEGMVRDGWISAEEALVHPQRNVVTRALGVEEPMLVDAWELVPVKGDRYLLCSDGLTNELSDAEILEILDQSDDPAVAATSLVQAACEAGGRDNVTVVVVDVVATETEVPNPPVNRVVATYMAVSDPASLADVGEADVAEAPEMEDADAGVVEEEVADAGVAEQGVVDAGVAEEANDAAESGSLELNPVDPPSRRSFLAWRSFDAWPLSWFVAVALIVLLVLLVLLAVL